MNLKDDVLLPTTPEAHDVFVSEIITAFDLPDTMDSKDMIATMILHLPTQRAFASREYFGHGVLKSMANQVAFKRLEEYRAIREAAEKAKQDEETQLKGASDVEIPNA